MKRFCKYIVATAAVCLLGAACTDYSDYNEAYQTETATSGQTLWTNLSENSSLTQFAALIRQVNFNDELDAAHFYTIWAPLDNTYNYDSVAALDSASIYDKFITDHIAEYNYPASGVINKERIHTLNEKMFIFNGGDGSYTYGDLPIVTPNIASLNGVIHTLNGAEVFRPNIYEYIFESEGNDSLVSFFKNYETTYLDKSKSVEGPLVNGRLTYIDSVMVTNNTLFSTLRADLSNEDSSFTLIVPNDEAWIFAKDSISPCFNYLTTTSAENLETSTTTTITTTIDSAYIQDSMVNRSITRNLVYNNNDPYNQWIDDYDRSNIYYDTIHTTTSGYLSDGTQILDRTVDNVKLSNGYFRVVDSLAFHPWDTWKKEITIDAANSTYRPRVTSGTPNSKEFTYTDEDTTFTFSYLYVKPLSGASNPVVYFYLPDVLSTTYNIYVVFVPEHIVATDTTSSSKPYKVNIKLSYCTAGGKIEYTDWKNTWSSSSTTGSNLLYSDATKIDTMFVGQFTFPVCYYGLGEYYPNLVITSKIQLLFGKDKYNYDNALRIASVILKPIEEEAYEEEKKQGL